MAVVDARHLAAPAATRGRRPVIALVLVPVMALVLAGCDGWTMFRAGAEHSGFNSQETTINATNVSTLTTRFTAGTGSFVESSPAVANGVVYVGSDDGLLYAFDAAGGTGCSGSPTTCAPLWTADIGAVSSSPAIVNGVVYVGSKDGRLYALDAAGITNCSGTPTTCTPLWTAKTGNSIESSPVVANNTVFIGSDDHKVYAFDAKGITGCSGTPTTCAPLWTAKTGAAIYSSPAVANGVMYVGSPDETLYAFDAKGVQGCSGTPKTCTPLWRAVTGGFIYSSPTVANGVVYVGSNDNKLYAFNAAGTTNCSGTAFRICQPLWTGATGGLIFSSPAVANGVVYVGSFDHKLYAFDASGTTGCSGTPTTCDPLWTGLTGAALYEASPAVGNGVVYIAALDGKVYAFDATGTSGCSGTPTTCTPLWTGATGDSIFSSPMVADGIVYVGSDDTKLWAFGLPLP
jgi:outer membrane protein assembly factor BamB